MLGAALRAPHPSFFGALWAALAAALAYIAGVWIGALASGPTPPLATSVVGRLAVAWVAAGRGDGRLRRGVGGDRGGAHARPPAAMAVGATNARVS